MQKIAPLIKDPLLAKKCRSRLGTLRHIISFSLFLVEKIQSWGGTFSLADVCFQDDDITELAKQLETGKGAFILFSHLGNAMPLLALMNQKQAGVSRKIRVTVIVDMKVNAHFTRMLSELDQQSGLDIIAADEIGFNTAALLEERIAAGDLVLVTGDRTSADGKTTMIPFLGKEAPFPFGVFYLAALTNAPIFYLFGLRQKDLCVKPKYIVHLHKSPLSFDCSRKERTRRCSLLVESYAALLEKYCKEQPFQWYNFYDFWQEGT